MNRFEKAALLAVISVTIMVQMFRNPNSAAYYELQTDTGGRPIWYLGWLIAIYGPTAVAVCFWRLSKHFSVRWLLHLLYLPCAVMVFAAGERIMLSVIQDPDFDSLFGAAVMPATLLLLISSGIYAAALVTRDMVRRAGPSATR